MWTWAATLCIHAGQTVSGLAKRGKPGQSALCCCLDSARDGRKCACCLQRARAQLHRNHLGGSARCQGYCQRSICGSSQGMPPPPHTHPPPPLCCSLYFVLVTLTFAFCLCFAPLMFCWIEVGIRPPTWRSRHLQGGVVSPGGWSGP